jgi:exosome complex RNA-binding protein Rrp42 (RNase PH superfamily)
LDKKQLVIIENKKIWHLYVDVFILQEYYNLSVFEGISIGIRGAFQSLKLPKLTISHNLITGMDEIDLTSENITSFTTFDMTGFPLLCLLGEIINGWLI